MKAISLAMTTILAVAFSSLALANPFSSGQMGGGIGLGAMYSGLGGNISLVSPNEMKYVSLGCTSYSNIYGSSCGFGLGWIKTDLFKADSNKHGVGLYLSKVGEENRVSKLNGRFDIEQQDIYGLGLSYTYFRAGIDAAGLNYGVSINITNADIESRANVFVQIGYQF